VYNTSDVDALLSTKADNFSCTGYNFMKSSSSCGLPVTGGSGSGSPISSSVYNLLTTESNTYNTYSTDTKSSSVYNLFTSNYYSNNSLWDDLDTPYNITQMNVFSFNGMTGGEYINLEYIGNTTQYNGNYENGFETTDINKWTPDWSDINTKYKGLYGGNSSKIGVSNILDLTTIQMSGNKTYFLMFNINSLYNWLF
jgi:hypothetical protein